MSKRRRRLPGEGDYGTDFDQAWRVEISEERLRVIRFLAGYEKELESVAEDRRLDWETGHISRRHAVSVFLLLPHLRGFWPMSSVDESDNVLDLSGQDRTMAGTSMTYGLGGTGGFMPVAIFSGSSAYLSRSNQAGLQLSGLSGGFALLGWVKPEWASSDTGDAPIVSKGDVGTAVEYNLIVDRDTMRPRLTVNSETFVSSLELTLDQWNFVAAVYDSSTHFMRIHVNEQVEDGFVGIPSGSPTTDPLYLGRLQDTSGSDAYWEGDMALMAFCGGNTPEGVIENLYHATRHVFGA